jgi:hypothetical protein
MPDSEKPTATEGVVDTPPQFSFSMPDEDDQVWLCDKDGKRCWLLGRTAYVAEEMCQWLGAIDYDENPSSDLPSNLRPIKPMPTR